MAALRASGVRAAVLLRPGLSRPPPAAGYHEKVGRAAEGRLETVRRPLGTTAPISPDNGSGSPAPRERRAGPGCPRRGYRSWEGSQDHRLGLMGREGGRIPARRAGRGGVFSRRAEAGGRERPGLCVFPLGPPLPEKQPSPFSEIEAPGAWLGLIAGSWAERGEPKSPDALQSSLTSSQRLGGEYASQPQF